MQSLEKIEWEKIFSFIVKTGQIMDINKYSYYFIKELNKLIPFYAANFFLYENGNKELKEPICFNISSSALKNYYDYYYKLDDIRKRAFDKPEPIRSTDLMNYKKWINTEYFNDFLQENNLFYSCGIDIHFKDRLLGTISIFRQKKEGNFELKDLMYLKLISQHSANHLYKLFVIHKLKRENEINKEKLIKKSGNQYNLTDREKQVLKLIIQGMSNQEIAAELFISINTVKKHISHLFNKCKVSSRIELIPMVYNI
ncbi:response regulator transcription factor [Halanaerobium hydrogeniformans]|uniref:Transcriptional regulator, LuxR family n=1 Tax=Halanaerobium hydrogeniformans TaxID=656519 RepID=E4RLE4_HALHG|nr:helix-turn-helix transcriptional regulator [Halanaerobium hydrogeniformans]ADQ14858.1 transcriptional regulator, LuxR family [Halanaerobium hydrogeniformans]